MKLIASPGLLVGISKGKRRRFCHGMSILLQGPTQKSFVSLLIVILESGECWEAAISWLWITQGSHPILGY